MKQIGLLLLALWLITGGVLNLTHQHFAYEKPALAVLALVSGFFLIISVIKLRFSDIGLLLLSIWLILNSCIQLFHVTFSYSDMTVTILAIASGLFLMIRK